MEDFILSYQNALDLSSVKILKGSVFRVSIAALLEPANRLLGVADLCSDWMWFKSRSNLWPYCLCSPSQWFRPLITLAIHRNLSEPCFFPPSPTCRANHWEQYSPQSLAALATLPAFTVNDVSLTPIVPGGIYRLACCCKLAACAEMILSQVKNSLWPVGLLPGGVPSENSIESVLFIKLELVYGAMHIHHKW